MDEVTLNIKKKESFDFRFEGAKESKQLHIVSSDFETIDK